MTGQFDVAASDGATVTVTHATVALCRNATHTPNTQLAGGSVSPHGVPVHLDGHRVGASPAAAVAPAEGVVYITEQSIAASWVGATRQ